MSHWYRFRFLGFQLMQRFVHALQIAVPTTFQNLEDHTSTEGYIEVSLDQAEMLLEGIKLINAHIH